MANTDAAFGFIPVRHLNGGQIRVSEYPVVNTNSTLLSKGDVAKALDTGYVERADANDGVACIGVFSHFEYTDAAGKFHAAKQMPATKTSFTNLKAYVWDDPFIVFKVQTDSGTATTLADAGETGNHVSSAGNTTTGLSTHELDASDVQAAGGLNFLVLRLYKTPGNDWGEHSVVEVIFNEHHYLGAAGAAV